MKRLIAFLILALMTGYIRAQVAGIERNTDGTTSVSFDRNGQRAAILPATSPSLLNKCNAIPGPAVPGQSASSLFDWKLKYTASGKLFKDVSFADDLTGYIVTELGSVYKTVNGGDNWISVMNLYFN